MAALSGPKADAMVEQLREFWYAKLEFLMDALSEDYPFGSTPLTQVEQYARYQEIKGDPYLMAKQVEMLEQRWRGFPDMRLRVERDLQRFVARMQTFEAQRGRLEVAV